jgi:hypothetical protein
MRTKNSILLHICIRERERQVHGENKADKITRYFLCKVRKTLTNTEIRNQYTPPKQKPHERLLSHPDHSVSLGNPKKKALTSPFSMLEEEIERRCCCQERSREYYTSVQNYPPRSIQTPSLFFPFSHYHRPAAPVNQPKVRTVTPTMENRAAYVCFSIKLIAPLQVAHT